MEKIVCLFLLFSILEPAKSDNVGDVLRDIMLGERSKRSYLPTKPWPDKIVPYVFDASVSQTMRQKYRGFMQTIAKHTCISFWEKATNATDHKVVAPNTDGFVFIHHENNLCYVSSVGYSSNGRRMSPCTEPHIYSHEFGHLLGLTHDIQRYDRNEYLFMMLDNAGDFYRPKQEVVSAQSTWEKCDFSPQSVMLPTPYSISRHGWPTFNYLYPNAGEQSTRNLFYYFKEISVIHGCCSETSCVSSACHNEGYLGQFGGTCQCVCPPGLDPETNCTSEITSRRSVSWPSAVSLVAPDSGCPDDTFVEGSLLSEGDGNNVFSTPNTLRGTQSSTVMQTDFCTKKDGNYAGKWGPGNYCILNSGIKCEDFGFTNATWKVNETMFTGQNKITNPTAFPIGDYKSDYSLYSFCCRDDGVEWNQLSLPNDQPFFLFRAAGYQCQNVEGMSVRGEYFIFDQAGPSSDQYGESRPDFVESSSGDRLTVHYCRYEPLNLDCGGTYHLTSSNPEVNISTPNHPGSYCHNHECNWAFTAPEGSSVLLTCGNVDISCGASLKIRKRMFGEGAVDALINEGNFMPPVLSIFNKLMLTFQSGQGSCTSTGFQCTASLASEEELPYTQATRGEDYCGSINYAVNENGFHECIPWSQVFENSPETFVPEGHLTSNHHCDFESNYCRNVAGDRLKPYCATSLHKGNVTIQYCDLGLFIQPFDVSHDCVQVLSRDPTCDLRETRRVCFKTCQDNNLVSNFPATETPAKDVTCSQPPVPSGTTNQNYNSAGYTVGTKVQVKCNGSTASRTFMCLSTGQWSIQENFCEDCPTGYDKISGNCYKGIDVKMTGSQARSTCQNDGTHLVWPESQDEFENVIIPYRDNTLKRPNSKIWFGMHPNTTHWFLDYDGSLVQGAYMWKNANVNGISTSNTNYMPWLQGRNAVKKNKLGVTNTGVSLGRPICKSKLTGGASSCTDKRSDCGKTLTMHPKLSLLQYAAEYCAYTTGECQASTCTVPTPATGVIASHTTLATGEFVTYECDSGYTEKGVGNTVRACQRNGSLTGQEMVCVAEDQAVTQLAYYPMQDTVEATKQNEITTGPSVYMTVKQNSSVKACRAYCRDSGNLKIQFWGPGGSPKHFNLMSEKTVTCVGGTANIWEFSTPLNVSKGEFVGVYDLTGNLIPRHDCYGSKNIDAAFFVRFYTVPGSAPSIGETFEFSLYPKCYIVMVDCLLVPDTYTGPAVAIEFRN